MYPHSEYTLPVLEKEKAQGGLPISILLGVKKADFFFLPRYDERKQRFTKI